MTGSSNICSHSQRDLDHSYLRMIHHLFINKFVCTLIQFESCTTCSKGMGMIILEDSHLYLFRGGQSIPSLNESTLEMRGG